MAYVSIMEPTGPSIAIYKGWTGQYRPMSKSETSSDGPGRLNNQSLGQRHFEFLNATNGSKDATSRKVARSHVMKEYLRDRKNKTTMPASKSLDEKFSRHSNPKRQVIKPNEQESVPNSLGFPTALCTAGYAIDMEPRMHNLMSRYLAFLCQDACPLSLRGRTNPLRSPDWFKFAVTDPAMLHGMLYSGAVNLALLEGRTESQDSTYHLYRTISVVNARLKSSTDSVDDSTIGALSCVALGGALAGHKEAWEIHMKGLRAILESKAGTSLNPWLTAKLHRTDIAGAIDYSETPHLEFIRSHNAFTWSTFPKLRLHKTEQDMRQIMASYQVHPALIDIVVDVAHFSQAIISWRSDPKSTIKIETVSEDMYWIEYRLLLFSATHGDPASSIDEACRMGSLLYMKTLLQEFPHSASGPYVLLTRLQASLQEIPITKSLSPLLMWLSLIGAALSKIAQRSYFMGLLEHFALEFHIPSFQDTDLEMSKLMGLEQVLGASLERIWAAVTETLQQRAILLQL